MEKDKVESRTPETPYELTDNERQIQNVYCWLRDRAANCRRLAESKTGSDRAGWLEDAVYFDDAMSLILLASVRPSVPQQGQAEQLTHGRNCAALRGAKPPIWSVDCSCGLGWRIQLQTEREMHNAWRKRAEEAEAALAASRSEEATPQTGLNKVLDVVAEVVQTLNDMQRVNLYANIIHDCTVGSEQAMSRLENENVNRA